MFSNVFRLGKDAAVRFTANGDPVCGLSLAYDVGFGQNKQTQWLDAALFGKTAESLAPYLLKGKQIYAELDDLRLEEYEGKTRLKARVVKVTLVGNQERAEARQEPEPRPQKRKPEYVPMADLDEDTPF